MSLSSSPQASTAGSSTVDNNNDTVRDQVVAVLSSTANGCLSELGYFPGMPLRLQKSEQLNTHLKAENMKLYQDNCRLVKMVAFHQDSAKLLAAPENAKFQQFKELSDKVRVLSEERGAWSQHYAVIMEKYHRAVADYNHLQEMYKIALNEIALLKSQCSHLQKVSPHSVGPTAVSMPMLKQDRHTDRQSQNVPNTVRDDVPDIRAVSASSSVSPAAASASMLRRSSGPTPGVQGYQPASRLERPMIYDPSNALSTSSKVPLHPISVDTRSSSTSSASRVPAPTSAPPVLAPYYNISALPNPTKMKPSIQTVPSATLSQSSLSTTLQPQDTSLHPPLGSSLYKRKSLTPPTPAMSPGNHSSPLEAVEALTPVDSTIPTADLIAGSESGSYFKKPRLQAQEVGLRADSVETKPNLQPQESSDVEDSEDEVIEVDADGLRLPESCVAHIIEKDEDSDGKQSCRGCLLRFREGLVPEAPKPFVRATMSELIQHCMNEHPTAWNLLRNDVGQRGG